MSQRPSSAASATQQASPGNTLFPDIPAMRAPSMEFVYRLVATMDSENGEYDIPNIQGTGVSRGVIHIKSGTVKGPQINGHVVENSGADWAERVHSIKIYYKLDARYAIKTDDGHFIYVKARGLFRPGPGIDFQQEDSMDVDYTQDEVEYFTHLTFEAGGDSPYNWMNGIVAIGVMTSHGGAAVIDCWRLTNFPGKPVEDVYVGR